MQETALGWPTAGACYKQKPLLLLLHMLIIIIIMLPNQAIASTPSAPRPSAYAEQSQAHTCCVTCCMLGMWMSSSRPACSAAHGPVASHKGMQLQCGVHRCLMPVAEIPRKHSSRGRCSALHNLLLLLLLKLSHCCCCCCLGVVDLLHLDLPIH
jgi:hypothetical protein